MINRVRRHEEERELVVGRDRGTEERELVVVGREGTGSRAHLRLTLSRQLLLLPSFVHLLDGCFRVDELSLELVPLSFVPMLGAEKGKEKKGRASVSFGLG